MSLQNKITTKPVLVKKVLHLRSISGIITHMSNGLKLLAGVQIPDFEGELPISDSTRNEWYHELVNGGRPAVKAFDTGVLAARILAGGFPEKLVGGKLERPFVVSPERNDPGHIWFTKALTLLAPSLGIEVHFDPLVNPIKTEGIAAYHGGTRHFLTSITRPASPDLVNELTRDLLPPDVQELSVFQVYTFKAFAEHF